MARMKRFVAEGMPHHITQRGNRRQQTFFSDDDYAAYIDLMGEWCGKHDVAVWAYCLMPNHVHMIAVPSKAENLRLEIGEAHRRYTRRVNFSKGWRGHLWQERFSSFVMDERYLFACTRYIENNPLRANLVTSPEQWRWSSASAHIARQDDRLVTMEPLRSMIVDDRRGLPAGHRSSEGLEAIRKRRGTMNWKPAGAKERFWMGTNWNADAFTAVVCYSTAKRKSESGVE